jgi:hypothetical protein
MQFVVKATSRRTGSVSWLTVRNARGDRMLGPRWMAAIFETDAEAGIAIAKMPRDIETSSHVFTVEKIG